MGPNKKIAKAIKKFNGHNVSGFLERMRETIGRENLETDEKRLTKLRYGSATTLVERDMEDYIKAFPDIEVKRVTEANAKYASMKSDAIIKLHPEPPKPTIPKARTTATYDDVVEYLRKRYASQDEMITVGHLESMAAAHLAATGDDKDDDTTFVFNMEEAANRLPVKMADRDLVVITMRAFRRKRMSLLTGGLQDPEGNIEYSWEKFKRLVKVEDNRERQVNSAIANQKSSGVARHARKASVEEDDEEDSSSESSESEEEAPPPPRVHAKPKGRQGHSSATPDAEVEDLTKNMQALTLFVQYLRGHQQVVIKDVQGYTDDQKVAFARVLNSSVNKNPFLLKSEPTVPAKQKPNGPTSQAVPERVADQGPVISPKVYNRICCGSTTCLGPKECVKLDELRRKGHSLPPPVKTVSSEGRASYQWTLNGEPLTVGYRENIHDAAQAKLRSMVQPTARTQMAKFAARPPEENTFAALEEEGGYEVYQDDYADLEALEDVGLLYDDDDYGEGIDDTPSRAEVQAAQSRLSTETDADYTPTFAEVQAAKRGTAKVSKVHTVDISLISWNPVQKGGKDFLVVGGKLLEVELFLANLGINDISSADLHEAQKDTTDESGSTAAISLEAGIQRARSLMAKRNRDQADTTGGDAKRQLRSTINPVFSEDMDVLEPKRAVPVPEAPLPGVGSKTKANAIPLSLVQDGVPRGGRGEFPSKPGKHDEAEAGKSEEAEKPKYSLEFPTFLREKDKIIATFIDRALKSAGPLAITQQEALAICPEYRAAMVEGLRRVRTVTTAADGKTARFDEDAVEVNGLTVQEKTAGVLKATAFANETTDQIEFCCRAGGLITGKINIEGETRILTVDYTGSEINAISSDIAAEEGLNIQTNVVLNIRDVNGGSRPVVGYAPDVTLHIGGVQITTGFWIMDSTIDSIILGSPFAHAALATSHFRPNGSAWTTLTDQDGKTVQTCMVQPDSNRHRVFDGLGVRLLSHQPPRHMVPRLAGTDFQQGRDHRH